MVFAREDPGGTFLLSDDWEGTVATDIVEAVDVVFTVLDQDELVLCDIELEVVTWLGEAGLVCDEHPFAREDCTPLKLVHLLGSVPLARKGSDGRVFGVLFRWRCTHAHVVEEGRHVDCVLLL